MNSAPELPDVRDRRSRLRFGRRLEKVDESGIRRSVQEHESDSYGNDISKGISNEISKGISNDISKGISNDGLTNQTTFSSGSIEKVRDVAGLKRKEEAQKEKSQVENIS